MEELDKTVSTETLSEAEIAARVEKLAQERAIELTNSAVSERVRKLNEKHELEKAEAIKDALNKAKMSTEELELEKVKALESEKADIEARYNELLNTSKIKEKLAEHNLPQTEPLIKSLLGNVNELDVTVKALRDALDGEIQKQVDEKLKQSSITVKKDNVSDLDKTTTKLHRTTASRIGVK